MWSELLGAAASSAAAGSGGAAEQLLQLLQSAQALSALALVWFVGVVVQGCPLWALHDAGAVQCGVVHISAAWLVWLTWALLCEVCAGTLVPCGHMGAWQL